MFVYSIRFWHKRFGNGLESILLVIMKDASKLCMQIGQRIHSYCRHYFYLYQKLNFLRYLINRDKQTGTHTHARVHTQHRDAHSERDTHTLDKQYLAAGPNIMLDNLETVFLFITLALHNALLVFTF